MGHTATDTRKVGFSDDAAARIEKSPSGLVKGETACGRLFKHARAHQVREHAVQGIGVTTCRVGKVVDLVFTRGNVVRDP